MGVKPVQALAAGKVMGRREQGAQLRLAPDQIVVADHGLSLPEPGAACAEAWGAVKAIGPALARAGPEIMVNGRLTKQHEMM